MANVLKIPIQGACAAVVVPLTKTGSTIDGPDPLVPLTFNSLASGTQLLIPAPDTAQTDTTYLEWKQTDGATVRYPANNLIVEGPTGAEATTGTGGGASSSITLVLNNIAAEHTAFSDFLDDVESWATVPVLVALALGKGYGAITHGNIGFGLVLGHRTTELPVGPGGNEPQTYTVTIGAKSGYTIDSDVKTALQATGLLGTVTPVLGAAVAFPDITSDALTALESGTHYRL